MYNQLPGSGLRALALWVALVYLDTEFFRRYIKTEKLDRKFSSLYTELMSKRQESDYDDFLEFKQEDILPLINKVDKFLKTIRGIIEKQ